ncbi:MAG: hypothetical protein VB102_09055 [Paludibacter sp.]|nr:hypothetical protein [Paludibacter sp.]
MVRFLGGRSVNISTITRYRSSRSHIPIWLTRLFEVRDAITGHSRGYYRTYIHAFQDIQSTIYCNATSQIRTWHKQNTIRGAGGVNFLKCKFRKSQYWY